ncbi:MAG: hypothetical protein WDO14_12560 [Bacteroidota bacterium]
MYKFWGLVRSPLTIFLIIIYLDETQQGYWYTFINLGALTVFAELGFTAVITQLVSHEFAHLTFNDGKLSGPSEYVDRLSSLVLYSVRLYSRIIPVAFAVLAIFGSVFLLRAHEGDIGWISIAAWVLYCLSGALTLIVTIGSSIVQGLGHISTTQRILFFGSALGTVGLVLGLWLGLDLWALGIGGIINFITCLYLLVRKYPSLIGQFREESLKKHESPSSQVLSLQWKFAVSWICGYFIFNLMTPLVLYYIGAVEAGKLGLSISIIRALSNIATAWGTVQIPQLNMHVSRKDFTKMNALIKRIQFQSLSIYILGVIGVIGVLLFVFPYFGWQDRVLPIREMLILLVSEISVVVVFNFAFYLRAFKREPYLFLSVGNAILSTLVITVSLWWLRSIDLMIILYTAAQLTIMVVATLVFFDRKKKYQLA